MDRRCNRPCKQARRDRLKRSSRNSSERTVELPLDIWAAVRDVLTFSEWAMACGTCRATRALRRPLVAATLRNAPDNVEQDLEKQLQLDRWTGCHSLFLNLSKMQEAVLGTSAAAPIEQLSLDGSLSSLHCLHIIGRDQRPLTKGSAEGVLVSFLAKHALLLTLHVKAVSMPFDLPRLQHLIMDIGVHALAGEEEQDHTHEALFPALSKLGGLKTLYVQSSGTTVNGATDLTACEHLRCVALQGVRLEGGMALPTECLLHVLHRSHHGEDILSTTDNVVTGLRMHHSAWCQHKSLVAPMQKLRRLQLTLHEQCGKEMHRPFFFHGSRMPALKVLELDVRSNVSLWLLGGLALESLVVIAAGTLEVYAELLEPPMTTVKQMYLRSGASFSPCYRKVLKDLYAEEPSAKIRLLDYVREEQDCWMAQMPANFQPSDLQQCWCGACSECLVRAGVPILCDQAWTSDGFDKHLRPHCNGMA